MSEDLHIAISVRPPAFRDGLTMAFEAAGFRCSTFADVNELVRSAWDPEKSVVVIGQPAEDRPDGLQICRRVRATSEVPIVLLVEVDEARLRIEAFDAGADECLPIDAGLEEILARVHALLRRAGHGACKVVYEGLVLEVENQCATYLGSAMQLTRTELVLLAALARRRGRVIAKTQLVAAVWGHGPRGANLVEVYIARLRRKFREIGAAPIQTVHGVGYRFQPSSEGTEEVMNAVSITPSEGVA